MEIKSMQLMKPLVVLTNVLIRSMGPVSEEDMMFSMDCYFRQNWRDARLSFVPEGNITELRPSIRMLDEIWKPDTFFLNGQESYLHTITHPNKLFRINTDGEILYSQRLTVKSTCPMNLKKYPLDRQTCPLMIGSYGYSGEDVVYNWAAQEDPVKKYKDITMSQFTLTGIETGRRSTGSNHGLRKILFVRFQLKREIGYYLLQIYLPCYLIVIISWVSFWINREAAPARVTLGITTLLTTSTIGLTGRAGIPKVSYSTALDIFLLMCFSFVFAALVEYAGVNYFTKGGQRDFQEDSDDDPPDHQQQYSGASSDGLRQQTLVPERGFEAADNSGAAVRWRCCCNLLTSGLRRHDNRRYDSMKPMNVAPHRGGVGGGGKGGGGSGGGGRRRRGGGGSTSGQNSVSRLDSTARVLFPFCFICLNVLYWAGFSYYL